MQELISQYTLLFIETFVVVKGGSKIIFKSWKVLLYVFVCLCWSYWLISSPLKLPLPRWWVQPRSVEDQTGILRHMAHLLWKHKTESGASTGHASLFHAWVLFFGFPHVTKHVLFVHNSLRLSSSNQMAKICSTLSYIPRFISAGNFCGICASLKTSKIEVKQLMSWAFINTFLCQVCPGIYHYVPSNSGAIWL